MFQWLSQLFRARPSPGDRGAYAKRPTWACKVSIPTKPIQLCSPLSPETVLRGSPQQSQAAAGRAGPTIAVSEGACQAVSGPDNAVPWPFPAPAGTEVFTFWGTKGAATEAFTLPGDAALRILANAGPFKLVIQNDDGTFLADVAELRDGGLGLMAIPQGGTYVLVIEALAEWGVSVVYSDTSGHPPAVRMPTAKILGRAPQPSDVFQPYMPSVHFLANMEAFFAKVRSDLAAGVPQAVGQRCFAIITPTRDVIGQTCPPPEKMSPDVMKAVRQLLPPCPPATISVISHTARCQTVEDMSRCIPFLGYLGAFASIGHSVVVFEGHPSAFESGVRNADLLFMDSGMLPFVQRDWAEVAHRIMRPHAKVFVHDRENFRLLSR